MNIEEIGGEAPEQRRATRNFALMIVMIILVTLIYIGAHAVVDTLMGRSMDDFWDRTLDLIWLPASMVPIFWQKRTGQGCCMLRWSC